MAHLTITVADREHRLTVSPDGTVLVDGWPEPATVTPIADGTVQVTLGGQRVLVYLARHEDGVWAHADGCPMRLELRPLAAPGPAAEPSHSLEAPMPATVIDVPVEPGQAVTQGDALILLEAMKMELTLRAPRDGTVAEVTCAAGDLVQPGRPLVTLTDEPAGQ